MREDDIDELIKSSTHAHEAADIANVNNGMQFVYCRDKGAVERRLKLASKQKDKGSLIEMLQNILQHKGRNPLAPMPENYTSVLREFTERYPHFSALSDYLRGALALSALSENPVFSLDTPLLLNGPPGIGKTHAVDFLASRLGTKSRVISCSDQTNGFDLTGLSSGWGTGQPGMVAEILIEERCSNPVIILDEVDKASKGDDKSPFEKSLYRLLEKDTARHFVDEYLKVELDAGQFNWMATSNEIEPVSAPIRDRFLILDLRAPTVDERFGIIRSVYADLLNDNAWGKYFRSKLSSSVVEMLATEENLSIRDMKKTLRSASSMSALRGGKTKGHLMITHKDVLDALGIIRPIDTDSNRIGFI